MQADSLLAETQGKPKNTGVGSLSLLQQISLSQESKQGLLHCRQIHQLSYEGSPGIMKTLGQTMVLRSMLLGDFPGGPVVENLPSNAGDLGPIPGWGTKIPHALGQLRLGATN